MNIHWNARALLALCLLSLNTVFMPSGNADTYTWEGGDGSFDSDNWSNSQGNMQGPPGGGDFCYIPEGSIVSGSGSVGTLDTAAAFGGGVTGSFNCEVLGSVLLNGGSVTAGIITSVSGDSAEDIFVTSGTVTAGAATYPVISISGGGSLTIGSSVPQGEGSVSGSMSTFTVQGMLSDFNGGAEAGGTISAESIQSSNGLDAMINSDGAGSQVTTTGNAEFDGQGISITDGGQATIGGSLILSPDPTNVAAGGSASIDGTGSSITVASSVVLGPGASTGLGANYLGNINLSDGGMLHAATVSVESPQNGGAIMMSNAGVLQVDSNLTVGSTYTGMLQVESGSSVKVGGNMTVDSTSSSPPNYVYIEGAGSSLTASGSLANSVSLATKAASSVNVAVDSSAMVQVSGGTSLIVGDAGSAYLNVTDGGTVQLVGTSGLEVGKAQGSNGSVSVSSANGLTVDGTTVVGDQGTGLIGVSGAGNSMVASGQFFVGGAGDESDSTGRGAVGVSGGGHLSISGSSKAEIGVGNGKGSIGQLGASGSGTVLNLTGATIVGTYGTGEIAATNGANAQSVGLELAATKGSVGNLLVYNAGTTWTEKNSLFDGGLPGTSGGHAVIAVNDSGLLRVYRKLYLANDGLATVKVLLTDDPTFPNPAPPVTKSPSGRIFVGTDNFGPDGAIRVGTGGTLSGKGKQKGTSVIHTNVVGNVVIGAGGRFQPGGDPDVFSVEGDVDLSDGGKGGGTTEFTVAGTGTPGTDYDQLQATGTVTLGGALQVVLLDGYKPKVGDTLDVVKGKSTSGSFTKVVSPSLTVAQVAGSKGLTVKVMAITSTAPPQITSAAAASATVGSDFALQLTATNDVAGFGATGLPAGLDLDPATGEISGAPTTPGAYKVALTATNASGTGTGTLTLTVSTPPTPGAPVISSATSESGRPGQAFTYTIKATNNPTSYTETGLPAGLVLNGKTGVISGKPAKAGTYTVHLSATNAAGTGAATLTIKVEALPVAVVMATIPQVATGSGDFGEVTVKLSAKAAAAVEVHYGVSGTAVKGKDYTALSGVAKIKAGKTSTTIKITPLPDLAGQSTKTVKITLEAGAGYTVGSAKTASVKIVSTH